MLRSVAALLSLAVLLAACSAQPVSQATTGTGTSTPAADATSGPAETAAPPAATEAPAASDTPTAAPTPTPRPTTATEPPKPGNPTWTLLGQTRIKATDKILERYKATWTEPEGVATKFILFGVKGCLRESKKYDGKPCVVKGMPIPKTSLVKLGSAAGDAREMEVSYERDEVGPGPYGAILIRAVNSVGNSIFTIVSSDEVCWRCTY